MNHHPRLIGRFLEGAKAREIEAGRVWHQLVVATAWVVQILLLSGR